MTYILYGYKVEKGVIRIDKEAAEKVIKMYEYYLKGKSLNEIGKIINMKNNHSRITNILKCKRYLGDETYPKIIDEELFKKVQSLMESKKKKITIKEENKIEYEYILRKASKRYNDPYKQAEYIYSLVERRVKT